MASYGGNYMLQWRSEFEIPKGLRTATKLHWDPISSNLTHNSGLSGFPAYFSLEIADQKGIFWQIKNSTGRDKKQTEALNSIAVSSHFGTEGNCQHP